MSATAFDPHRLLAESRLGVLATIKSDGWPQLSPVQPFYDLLLGEFFRGVLGCSRGRFPSSHVGAPSPDRVLNSALSKLMKFSATFPSRR